MSQFAVPKKGLLIIALCLGLMILAMGVMALAAASAPVTLTGTVGVKNVDGASLTNARLRHTGNPAPAGYSHNYQWARPAITCMPEVEPVVFEGTIDATNIPDAS